MIITTVYHIQFALLLFYSDCKIHQERTAIIKRLAMMSIVTPAMIMASADEQTHEHNGVSRCDSAVQVVWICTTALLNIIYVKSNQFQTISNKILCDTAYFIKTDAFVVSNTAHPMMLFSWLWSNSTCRAASLYIYKHFPTPYVQRGQLYFSSSRIAIRTLGPWGTFSTSYKSWGELISVTNTSLSYLIFEQLTRCNLVLQHPPS